MPTPYEKIYENLLPKFRDYEIPFMTEDEVKEQLHDYIVPAISKFHVCSKDLNDRDDELEQFNIELSENEIEILSNYALLEYIDSNYIRTPVVLKASLSSTDFNAFSNANLLAKLLNMRDVYRKENETLLSRYAWIKDSPKNNSDFGSLNKLKQNAGMKKS